MIIDAALTVLAFLATIAIACVILPRDADVHHPAWRRRSDFDHLGDE